MTDFSVYFYSERQLEEEHTDSGTSIPLSIDQEIEQKLIGKALQENSTMQKQITKLYWLEVRYWLACSL